MKSTKSNLPYICGLLSILGNLVLFALKFWAGVQSASLAIMADAWHTLSDSLTSIVLIIGEKVTRKPPDEDHPFGHGRAELISAVIIGTILGLVGFNFIIEAVQNLSKHQSAQYNKIAIFVVILSVLVKELMAQFAIWAGKKEQSQALIADGWHHRSDALTSIIVLVGILVGRYAWWIDSVLTILVALLIFWVTFEILTNAINKLIGKLPSDEWIQTLHELIQKGISDNSIQWPTKSILPFAKDKNTKFDLDLHHIHLHEYGGHKELTFHIRLPGTVKLAQAHQITDQIEDVILKDLGVDSTIHIEPQYE